MYDPQTYRVYRTGAGCRLPLAGTAGWCRNEWDGTVTMEIQGSEKAIDLVIRSIQAGRYIWIQGMDVTEIPPDDSERGFRTD